MAIYTPGQKFRKHRLLAASGKRELVAMLSLTAMVDMFTVLVIFLLQSYSSTGEVIFLPKDVQLPKAEKIKDLKPAVVVTISNKEVLIDKNPVIAFEVVKAQTEWMIQPLFEQVQKALAEAKAKYDAKLGTQVRGVVQAAKGGKPKEVDEDVTPWNKITVQADKGMDFLTVKKVMYTVTEAGAGEINFAVMKQTSQ
jgi:biopolymer transport protein ExbD